MSTWAVTMVRDEADVIEGTVRHLFDEGVAGVIVADNRSTDDTRKILHRLTGDYETLHVLDDDEVGYYQSRKMTALAERAHQLGAKWIVPVDADEVWVSRVDRLSVVLANAPANANVALADLYQHFPSAVDPVGDDPFRTIQWRQPAPARLQKIAFRWEPGAVIHQGNHGVDLPRGVRPFKHAELEVHHFPYRSAEQFTRKARNGAEAYRATDLPDDAGAHWRSYGDLLDRFGEEVLHDVFREHFWFLSPVDAGLIHDPAPYRRWLE